ncbi:MAG TPA: DinB family protein [Polyangia bacterium]|nr:DinB family protein [Polyangia bacterium]
MTTIKPPTLFLMLAFTLGAGARAQAAAPAKSTLQTDLVGQVGYVEKEILELEDAVPQDKYTWRPAPGVRSISEVYLHIAFGNYGLGKMITGKAPPADAKFDGDAKKWDAQTTDKAAIKKILQTSFDYVREAIKGVPEKDLDKEINFFGHEITTRSGLITIINHEHEHLGQSIAYARANNVTPPWSKGEKGEHAEKMEKAEKPKK